MDSLEEWQKTIYSDLELLRLLHDREPDAELLAFLQTSGFPHWLGLRLEEKAQETCLSFMAEVIQGFPANIEQPLLDELAADFAAIYLNHSIQASPCESVWLDEEGLMRQQPMFAVRAWYKEYGLEVENWRLRTDDHLVCQLQFIGHLFSQEADPIRNLQQAAHFMDEHILLWIKPFAQRVSQRAATPYYAGLALLTASYLETLREVLAEFLDLPQEQGV